MQVTSSTSSPAVVANASVNALADKQQDSSASTTPESSTKVTLSDEGLQKSAQDSASGDATKADTSGTADTTSDTASQLKSVTYGVLGLPDPTKPQPDNKAFGIGKGIAAIGTVVSVIMLALKFL
jgi:hypothetical protein